MGSRIEILQKRLKYLERYLHGHTDRADADIKKTRQELAQLEAFAMDGPISRRKKSSSHS